MAKNVRGKGWQERRSANGEQMLAILRECATKGQPCPGTGVFMQRLDITDFMVVTLFDDLRKAGKIEWTSVYSSAHGRRRLVRLVQDGISTAKPDYRHRAYTKAPSDPTLLDRARVALQRRGHYVWDARISGGPRGMIKVDHHIITPGEVIALAGLSIERRV